MRLENYIYDLFSFFVSHENNVRSFVCTYKRRQEALSTSINLINHIHNLKIYVQAFLFLYTSNLIHFYCLTWTRAKNLKLLDLGFRLATLLDPTVQSGTSCKLPVGIKAWVSNRLYLLPSLNSNWFKNGQPSKFEE